MTDVAVTTAHPIYLAGHWVDGRHCHVANTEHRAHVATLQLRNRIGLVKDGPVVAAPLGASLELGLSATHARWRIGEYRRNHANRYQAGNYEIGRASHGDPAKKGSASAATAKSPMTISATV